MGIDKEELSSRFTKKFKGHFLKREVTNVSTFKTELLSHCSSTVVYDMPFSGSVSTFVQCKIAILLHKTEPVTYFRMLCDPGKKIRIHVNITVLKT
jgi:hypothetical protein